jgi:nucleoid DNA-binding protein
MTKEAMMNGGASNREWQYIDRDKLVARLGTECAFTVAEAERLMTAIEDAILEVWDVGGAVEFPGLGPIDALEEETSRSGITVWTLPELDDRVATVGKIDIDTARRAVEHLTTALTGAVDNGDIIYYPLLGDQGPTALIDQIKAEDLAQGLLELRSHHGRIWVLQCNPERFDVLTAVEDDGELPDSWSVSRYFDEIKPGDAVVFWLTGRHNGVYALGEVTSEPYPSTVDTSYVNPGTTADWDTYIDIELFVDLWDRRIPRALLKADRRFAGASIIRVPGAANPHPLERSEFEAILDYAATSSYLPTSSSRY